MNRILVTGGAGFVGSHIALAARERLEADVVVLDNLNRQGSELNLPALEAAGISFIHGDIRNPADIASAGPCNLIVECSAEPSVLAGINGTPDYVVHTNLTGALHCFEYARKQNAGVIFLSTSRVYPIEKLSALSLTEEETRFTLVDTQAYPGASSAGIAEEFPTAGPRSYYGASKFAAEIMLAEYGANSNVPYVVNRFGVIAGPRQMGKVDQGVVALWVARHIFGGALSYIGFGGTGKQIRDMLHIDDAVELIMRQASDLAQYNGETFNVGGGLANTVSLQELTAICRDVTGNEIAIDQDAENRPADIPAYITDNRKITEACGWQPEKDVRTIVSDVAVWMDDDADRVRRIFAP